MISGWPHTSVMGAFPYRGGRIVPLIDLCIYLDKGRTEDEDPKIIITEFNNIQNSFLVSGVTRIHRISWSQVEAPSQFMLEMSRKSITGVVRLENRVVFLLDMEAIVGTLHPALGIRGGTGRRRAASGISAAARCRFRCRCP